MSTTGIGLGPDAGTAGTLALAGIYAPITTPFDQSEAVDFGALRQNLARYAASGIQGYLALGSNGENRSLDEEERDGVLQVVVRERAPGQVVMAGAAYESQRAAERFLARAADIGADCALVLSPGYYRKQMTEEVLYRYFATLADTALLPLLLYNAPGFNGITLEPAMVARLAGHERIVGMKDSASSGIEHFLALQAPGFDVLAGSADFLFPAMVAGSPGGTVSLADSFPHAALRLYALGLEARAAAESRAAGKAAAEAHREADVDAGTAYQDDVRRVNARISGAHGVAGVKAAMDLAGYVGGPPRRPLLPLDDEQRAALRASLEHEGLL